MNTKDFLLDYKPVDVSKEVDLVWSIANSLRGAYTSDKYKDVIIPMVIIRRFECALENTKDKVVAMFKANRDAPAAILYKESTYPFYNTSEFSLKNLLNDSDNIATNLENYYESFSANVQIILNNLNFKDQIKKMDKANRLYGVVKKFSELNLYTDNIDSMKMGYIFEDIIRRFSENAEAGDHYTPREVIRLMTNLLLAEGCNDLLTDEGKVATVLDAACGSGGMLSTANEFLKFYNPNIDVRLFGQEIIPESYAICLADMMIKGQDVKNIIGGEAGNTLKKDCFPDQKMRLVIMNPPFGTPWGGKDAPEGQEKKVRDENKSDGRFEWGLPGTGDAQLLFMQHAINKLDDKSGRAAIITNGSPLFSGGTTSGESQIRRYMLEEDLIEAIIALPSQLFYNTDIGIYIFILSRNKREDRKGKIQLINAVDMWKPLNKSLGKKRREIDRDSIKEITKLYANFSHSKKCKIFSNEDFMYKEYAVYQPLQRSGSINAETIEKLRTSSYFISNSHIFNEAEFENLIEMNPRNAKDEKKYQKYILGHNFTNEVIEVLSKHTNDTKYNDYAEFEKAIKNIISKIDGYSTSRLSGIAMVMSEMDKSAIIQKEKNGNIIVDKSTKDTEIISLTRDVEYYFEDEVYPHIPDALWFYEFDETKKESSSNKEKLGAEFPFTRFFYEYKEPQKAEDLLSEFMEIEKELASKIKSLNESEAL
ncbi:MAG: N-6 DNA methylase [Aminipila sp.]